MKVLILGATGMLGHRLCRTLSPHVDLWTTLRGDPREYGSFEFAPEGQVLGHVDATDESTLRRVLEEVAPDAVVNAVGIVKQRDEAKAHIPSIRVNALFPHVLAEACRSGGARLIHVSTDCVFSGDRGGYSEDDVPDPRDLYGHSKLLGEVDEDGCLTLRTSIVGWEIRGGFGLLEWLSRQRGTTIKGWTRATYTGLATATLCELIGRLLSDVPDLHGMYHVSSEPISKYELLTRLCETLGWDDIVVERDDSVFCDRSLVSDRFRSEVGWEPPSWDEMIHTVASEWPTYLEWRER